MRKQRFMESKSFSICASLTSTTLRGLEKDLSSLCDTPPDLLEWRADYFREKLSDETIREGLKRIRKIFPDLPLIFTVRSHKEGGKWVLSRKERYEFRACALETGQLDLVDIELSEVMDEENGPSYHEKFLKKLKSLETLLILSYHDFFGQPDKDRILQIVEEMTKTGADIAKVAVMPLTDENMIQLKEIAAWLDHNSRIPYILIGMGSIGMRTRYDKKEFSSVLTYASVGESSASGQFTVADLYERLKDPS